MTNARYVLEYRSPITIAELNDALDDGRVNSIERRGRQIIGTMRTATMYEEPFVLSESGEHLSTDADRIFASNESEKLTFENLMMWRFHQKTPDESTAQVSASNGALETALRFFWSTTDRPITPDNEAIRLAELTEDTQIEVSAGPADTLSELNVSRPDTVLLPKGSLVKILSDESGDNVSIETANGQIGSLNPAVLNGVSTTSHLPASWWPISFLFGLMPWAAFIPIVIIAAMTRVNKFTGIRMPFRGEYCFQTDPDSAELAAPYQYLLLSWLGISVASLVPAFFGHTADTFTGIFPIICILSVSLTSPRFWAYIRKTFEARWGLIAFAIATLALAFFCFNDDQYHQIRFLLVHPIIMQGGHGISDDGFRVVYFTISIMLVLVSITGISNLIQRRILSKSQVDDDENIENWSNSGSNSTNSGLSSSGQSSTTLRRVSRISNEKIFTHMTPDGDKPPYAPMISFALMGVLYASHMYFTYIPTVSEAFTENALVSRYFQLANNSEQLLMLSGDAGKFCRSYEDCDEGYMCRNSKCEFPSSSSYALNIAHPISRSEMMADIIMPQSDATPAMYAIPKDSLFKINQAYRAHTPENARRNITVVDAPSARFHLLAPHMELESHNPLDAIFPDAVPDDASKLGFSLSDGSNSIILEGFRTEHIDLTRQKKIEITLYYKILNRISQRPVFNFTLDLQDRSRSYEKPALQEIQDVSDVLTGDLIADRFTFDINMMPAHGSLDILVGMNGSTNNTTHKLTTIHF